jgi:hypothetical protein
VDGKRKEKKSRGFSFYYFEIFVRENVTILVDAKP